MSGKRTRRIRREYIVSYTSGGTTITYPSFRAARSDISKAFGRVYWSPWQRLVDDQVVMEAYKSSEDLFLHQDPVGLVLLVEGVNADG